MSKFIIDKSFWELFPKAKLGVILLKDFKNSDNSPQEVKEFLKNSNEVAKNFLTNEVFSENSVIKIYREAYQKFKTKKGARSSIEALMKRIEKGSPIPSINTLVDIYNAVSLRFALPCGAEDIDTFVGDLHLTVTDGNDSFYLIGDTESSPTLKGELCYKDDIGAVCRCFNWRDGERTMITNKTKNAFIVIELLTSEREEDLKSALKMLDENCKKYLGGVTEIAILTIDDNILEL